MLDYIYRPTEHFLSDVGKNVYRATTTSPNANSIRFRQAYLAELIGSSVEKRGPLEVLSVACGHMRELDLCPPSYATQLNISALDQDNDTLLTLTNNYPDFSIKVIPESITSILKPTFRDGYDLIYSAGLFDYLNDKLASKLIHRLSSLLRQGGVLSVANFLPDNHGRGYMEGFMEWSLIYRSQDELEGLAKGLGTEFEVSSFTDDFENVAYLELHKR